VLVSAFSGYEHIVGLPACNRTALPFFSYGDAMLLEHYSCNTADILKLAWLRASSICKTSYVAGLAQVPGRSFRAKSHETGAASSPAPAERVRGQWRRSNWCSKSASDCRACCLAPVQHRRAHRTRAVGMAVNKRRRLPVVLPFVVLATE
jgi:hypothetical protein